MGTHTLIKQGAKLVEHAQDILEELSHLVDVSPEHLQDHQVGPAAEPPSLSVEETLVVNALGPYPIHIDDLGRKISMDPGKLASILLKLELQGVVQQSPGKLFTVSMD